MKQRPLVATYIRSGLRALHPAGPLAANDTARVLHYLLLALFSWYGFWVLVLLPYSTAHPPHLIAIGLIELTLAVAIGKLRAGKMRQSSWIYLTGTWLYATVIIVQNGGIRSPVLALYVAIPVSAVWLLGYRVSLFAGASCIGSAMILVALDIAGVELPHTIVGTSIGICIQLAGAILMAVVPLAQVLRALTEALARERGQFQALERQEQELRQSEERFRRVFEDGPLGLGLVAPSYRFLKVNSAFCRMVGYSEEELLEKTFVDITHPDDIAACLNFTEQLFHRQIPFFRTQKRYLTKTGEIIWINVTGSTIRDQNNEPLYGLAMIEDVTEVKHAHDEALVRQKLESLGTLAGGIAHDFNNLLGSVHSLAELASAELDTGSSCSEELKSIREAAMRGSEIVRQLMIYAGQDSGDVELVDLSKIVDEMLSLLKVSVNKRAKIEADLDQDLPPVRANAAQIRQIVMNLITNASDAITGRDGVIRVITRRVTLTGELAALSSRTLAAGDYVQLEVSDTGCGMSPQIQSKAFDPFFSTKSAGRGLGLSVVEGAVRSLSGAIHLSSEPGKGTTFRVSLHFEETTAGASAGRTSGVDGLGQTSKGGTLLVVEDEVPLRQAVAKMLRKTGFEIIEAADGNSAIELIHSRTGEIDGLLLDLTVPGASSSEVVAEALKVRPDIRVIVTSAYGEERIKDVMREGQIYSFIRKPFQIAHLIQTLKSTIPVPK
ncbi:MAG TPA: PAS domain S-box protein [Bryobacteraceae bacterium]|nr:PAS domain S-box protein [Bryobacteraceae bacterium]